MKTLSTLSLLALAILLALPTAAVPKLNSLPGTEATIFLDFDGHYVINGMWNGGIPLNCAPSPMVDVQITEVFNRTAEDYRPFDVNITTDSAVFLAAPLTKRVRIIVTTTSSWYTGVAGVAYIGSFVWGDDTPAFVFCDRLGNNAKMVAEACSHESGHTVGLSHQSRYDGVNCVSPIETYNSGTGNGEAGWAPIMGNSYYKNMSNWNNGPTPYGCTNVQDNLSIITTQNGFGYRADDFADTFGAATQVNGNFSTQGIISTNTDKDAFKVIIAKNANFHINAVPFSVGTNNTGANLDIKLMLYNAAGALINTYDPATSMSATVDTVLNAGTYFLQIDGTGNTNVGEYGSLGSYSLTGIYGALAIHEITLRGHNTNDAHTLNWSVAADEAISSVVIETSTDGSLFKELATVNTAQFTYTPVQQGTLYYRLKIYAREGQAVYSNTISLKAAGTDNIFKVSALIQNQITVNAAVPYQFQLSDINGRVISRGNGISGFNNINISNQPKGIYIIQLLGKNRHQTERILKQ